MHTASDTICALATAPGVGGIGIVRVSGPAAFAIVNSVTRRPKNQSCADWKGHTLHAANVTQGGADGPDALLDRVLLAVFHAPRSFTGEDVVEVHAHGGPVTLRRILERLLAAGCRLARPGEFTERAFVHGKMDLAQAEAVADIISAQTDAAHDLAQRQAAGLLSEAVRGVRHAALGILAQIEAAIDFPEDVGELDTAACAAQLEEQGNAVDRLLQTARRGILTRSGLHIVLVGRPNVGKSSLLNALLGHARAIVSPIPGTTRDVVEDTFQVRGIPIRAADTAGLRDTSDEVEREGVERSRAAMAQADLILLVLDASEGMTDADRVLLSELAARPHLVIWNKWDLAGTEGPPGPPIMGGGNDRNLPGGGGTPLLEGQISDAISGAKLPPPIIGGPGGPLPLSAATGWNLPALEDAIADAVGAGDAVPSKGAVVTHARHQNALQTARKALETARQTLLSGLPIDFASGDVRAAINALGEITGETAGADITREIFSRFCIGK